MRHILSATLENIDSTPISVEASLTKGLPNFSIVGLANSSILESKDRVKSALLTNSFKFPPKKITINLSPSDIKKSGSHFDLAIALLIAIDINIDDIFVFGELGLDGALKDTNSIFPIVLSLAKNNLLKKVLIPKSSYEKLSKIPNIEIFVVENLKEAIDFFDNREKYRVKSSKFESNSIEIDSEKYYFEDNFELDFADVKSQKLAKRASLIASSGFHNILLEGVAGSGKSMIAKRLKYILPPMSKEEILERAKLESLVSIEPDFKANRSFRSPHHSSTRGSIFGGGSKEAKIGEVALANSGVLFFDELPYFDRAILEALREPLEDNQVNISRVNSKVKYETSFLFIGALNPCLCGNLYSQSKECRCSEVDIKRYRKKLSEPLLDRIDVFVKMGDVDFDDSESISSKEMFKMVLDAFSMQKSRGQKRLNGKLNESEIKKYCKLDSELESILNRAIKSFNLSFRAINKILKVSRTIADLNREKNIKKTHLLEALSFRDR